MDLSEFSPEAFCIVLPAAGLFAMAMIGASSRKVDKKNNTPVSSEEVPKYSHLRARAIPWSPDELVRDLVDQVVTGEISADRATLETKPYWEGVVKARQSEVANQNGCSYTLANVSSVGIYGLLQRRKTERIEQAGAQLFGKVTDGSVRRDKALLMLTNIGLAGGIAGLATYTLYAMAEHYIP